MHTRARTYTKWKRFLPVCYVLNDMHKLTDLSEHALWLAGKGKFRRLDYSNRSALDLSCEMYNFDRCFPAAGDAKKGQL